MDRPYCETLAIGLVAPLSGFVDRMTKRKELAEAKPLLSDYFGSYALV